MNKPHSLIPQQATGIWGEGEVDYKLKKVCEIILDCDKYMFRTGSISNFGFLKYFSFTRIGEMDPRLRAFIALAKDSVFHTYMVVHNHL